MTRATAVLSALLVGLISAAAALALPSATAAGKAQQWLYSCSSAGVPYKLSLFDQAAGAEEVDSPQAAALRRFIEKFGEANFSSENWRLAGQTERLATFVNGEPPQRLAEITVQAEEPDRWSFRSSSHGCRPAPFIENRRVPKWKIDKRATHRRAARRVQALTRGSYCSSGRPPHKRLRRPMISYGERRIVIAAVEAPPRGFQTCLGNPQTKTTFRLREPIGARTVVDGSAFPFRKRLDLRGAARP